jgi:hypothetical protein
MIQQTGEIHVKPRGIPAYLSVQIQGPVHREDISILFQAQLSR